VQLLANDLRERDDLIAEAGASAAAGRYAESLALICRALAATPNDPELNLARAATLFAWRRCWEARDACLQAATLGLRSKNLYLHAGWSCFAVGKIDEAAGWMQKAVALDPESADSHVNLAVVLQAQERHDDAIASYQRALALQPRDFDCHIGLGSCHLRKGDAAAAEIHFRSAIAVDSGRMVAWQDLGAALGRQRRHGESLQAFAYAHSLGSKEGEDTDSFVSLAVAFAEAGKTQEALALYERNLPRRPNIGGYYAYSHLLLGTGQFRDGWRYHESRWLNDPQVSLRPDFRLPVWAGQQLRDKTILLHVEQGFGDIIQFIRYAPQIKALGATVLLRASRPIQKLAQRFAGVDRVVSRDESPPEFDFYIHLLSLPHVFDTDLSSIPAEIPYLHADPVRSEEWSRRLAGDGVVTIGLAWSGNPEHPNDRYRSLSLRELGRLGEIKGVRWVSLQKGEGAREAEAPPPGMELMNLGPELEDFADTAALISQVDLVLCVDTAVAHLAGALGKLVWVMLPSPADWRWLEGRDDSPWYPTMRLFRQSRRGEWDDVIERVKAALQERLRDGASATTPSADRPVAMVPVPQPPVVAIPSQAPGHRPGFSAVAECRYGILQYLPDEGLIGDSLGWYGEYLQPQLDLLARLIRPGATILEVGAGVGEHALCLAAAVGEAGHLFLYESRPVVKRILQQNLGANRVTNVTLMRRTLGATGEATDHGSETLDELQLERLDWLKINGSVTALDILDGGTETLWRLRPLLFLATADEPALTSLASRVKEFSYRCWRMDTALFNPQNFNRRDTDIFSGRTALALLAIPEEIEVDMALDECVEIS
jgi:tetratricopeptide (TPR) repeat protein/precorrin-6B methylase 2